MCGRYFFIIGNTSTEAASIMKAVRDKYGDDAFGGGEIYPGTDVPVILGGVDTVVYGLAHWGVTLPNRSSLLINARSEGLARKPLFAAAFISGRCLIPASGFYEWNSSRSKYRFSAADGSLVYMAGLIAEQNGKKCCVVITTASNSSLAGIHQRMPLILPAEAQEDWLYDTAAAELLLSFEPHELIAEQEK